MSSPFLSVLDDNALLDLLRDDVPYGDLTTRALNIDGAPAQLSFTARDALCVCGIEEARRMFELAGARAEALVRSGERVERSGLLLQVSGRAAPLLAVWKVAQTLVEYASGIASAAAALVDVLKQAGLPVPVACTRKHFPGTKALSVKAVLSGGALMHRLGLSETLLVFPEHRAFLPASAWTHRLAELARTCPEKKRVAEVTDLAEALALADQVEVLQLEKFSVEAVAACAQALRARQWRGVLAAAGGVNVQNAVAYARAGADLLVTSAPYFAVPAEVKVHIQAMA